MRRSMLVVLSVLAALARLPAQSAEYREPLPGVSVDLLAWDEASGEFIAFAGTLAETWQWLPGSRPAAIWSVSFEGVTGWGLPSGRRYRIVTDFERWIPLADSYPQKMVLERVVFVCEAGSPELHARLEMAVTILLAAPAGPAAEVVTVRVKLHP